VIFGFPDPGQCAKVLQVKLTSRSETAAVFNSYTELIDIRTASQAEIETFDRLEKLEADAKARRVGNAEMPDL